MQIIVNTNIQAPIDRVWEAFTNPADIMQWCHASEDWHVPNATNDLRVGGAFVTTMAAKDGSVSFDFTGTYDEVIPAEKISYTMTDGRKATITFVETPEGVKVEEAFDPENENPIEMQRGGWQSILDNFKKHVEQGAE